ncbi:ABC transporter ATP-binding protein [Jiangella alkaliphila]|uniref:Peptide/nickel transport system ATP-binding protein n=1 Tax=Jiangella alkaliphila TaxID=419479 RepID=A0A1H2LDK5_9ACTN|nr:ABC transporter ATP-binding protein [Jiangella alkaliphila]SDU78718.1 peptide/nickel transport system ATP-binding protein [Jiangella alkaliphila]
MSALEIDDVAVEFATESGPVRALDGASLTVRPGSSVAIVGESGSGKSTLASLIGRLQPGNARIVRGSVHVDGRDVAQLDTRALRELRRTMLGSVPQDPIESLDPTLRIGRQLQLVLRLAGKDSGVPARRALLEGVRIDDPDRVLRLHPHEVSGGMAQRIAIAIAMCRSPRILVADEPTAALDAQVREDVIRLMFEQARATGTTIVWLSHDLPTVARWCDEVAVMYAGRIVEHGPAAEVLGSPVHPYTRALAAADPTRVRQGERLASIGGGPPVLHAEADGCAFAPRCAFADDACSAGRPGPSTLRGRVHLCRRAEALERLEVSS